VDYPSLNVKLGNSVVIRGEREPALHNQLEERCALVSFYPGMPESTIEAFTGFRGLVIAGTGLGHISTSLIAPVKSLIEGGTMVTMTSQCLNGRICDRVYDTGRDLLAIGVIEGGDMLPEVALVKLMWVLGNESDLERAKTLLMQDIRGECNRRSLDGL
jgi:glutamyl-tRNA(Gln) amidotransferase subunit D